MALIFLSGTVCNQLLMRLQIMDGSPSRGTIHPHVEAPELFYCVSSHVVVLIHLEHSNIPIKTSKLGLICVIFLGETIPIRLFLGGFDLTPTFRDVNKKFSTRYFLSLVLIDEGE
jgi:hypothetical protein